MAKRQCNNCQTEVCGYALKCSDCPDVDLCLQCYSLGAETGGHTADHGYQISLGNIVGAFDSNDTWSLPEETMLLDAVEQYGFGNWEDVANHVESRASSEAEQHYSAYFIRGTIGKATFTSDCFGKVTDHTCPAEGPLSPSISVPVNPLDLSIEEQHSLSYMPLRDDFEREHDNESETLVSSLSIGYDDDDLDIAIKLAQVDKYRMRLKERDRRKQLAGQYGLITQAAQQAAAVMATVALAGMKPLKSPFPKKRGSKEDREFQEKMKPFSQCWSCKEHEQMFEDNQNVEEFEDEKYKREKKREKHLKKLGSLALVKRHSMASKKAAAEEKLDILIDESGPKDEEAMVVDTKEMAKFPGYDLLSARERKLCNSIAMTPANYVTVKTCIVKDYLTRRNGFPIKIRYPSGMDKTHRRQIMSFLADNGWIGLT